MRLMGIPIQVLIYLNTAFICNQMVLESVANLLDALNVVLCKLVRHIIAVM